MFDRDRRLFAKEKTPDVDETPADPAAKHRSQRFGGEDVDATTTTHTGEHAAPKQEAKPGVTAEQSNAAAEAAFADAEKKYAAKDFRGALAGYTTAWESSVIDNKARGQLAYNIAQCHRMLHDSGLAVVWYQAALASGGVEERRAEIEKHVKAMSAYVEADVTANAKFLEGEQLMKAKQYAKAAAAYLEAWEQPDLAVDARGPLAVNRARCLKLLGDTPNAITWYQLALQIGGPTVEALRDEIGRMIVELGGAAEVEDTAKPANEGTPDLTLEERFAEADALFRQGAPSEALPRFLALWETSAATAEHRGSLAYNIAQCYRLERAFGKAITWYELALSTGGSEVDRIRSKIEDFLEEAKEQFEAGESTPGTKADDAFKADVRAQRSDQAVKTFEAAEAAYRVGDYAVALPLYKQVWEANVGTQGEIAFNIGQCHKKLGQLPQAIAWLEDAMAEGAFDPATAKEVLAIINELRREIGAEPKA